MTTRKLLEASAGAGKTWTIVHDILDLIKAQDDLELKQIVAITFTKAATNELKERFNKFLVEALKEENKKTDKEINIIKRLNRALEDVDSINISTIHSFCNNILNLYSFDVQLPLEKNIVTDRDEFNYYQELFSKAQESVPFSEFLFRFGFSIKDLKDAFFEMQKYNFVQFDLDTRQETFDNESFYREFCDICNQFYKKIDSEVLSYLRDKNLNESYFPIFFSSAFKPLLTFKSKLNYSYEDVKILKDLINFNSLKFKELKVRNISKKDSQSLNKEDFDILNSALAYYKNNIQENLENFFEEMFNRILAFLKKYNDRVCYEFQKTLN